MANALPRCARSLLHSHELFAAHPAAAGPTWAARAARAAGPCDLPSRSSRLCTRSAVSRWQRWLVRRSMAGALRGADDTARAGGGALAGGAALGGALSGSGALTRSSGKQLGQLGRLSGPPPSLGRSSGPSLKRQSGIKRATAVEGATVRLQWRLRLGWAG